MQPDLSKERRMTFLTSLGSAIEYYDFVVYGMLAKYLKVVFFPITDDLSALLQFFSIFALGYLARPFGGVLSGILGDRFGRRPIFLSLTFLMALSTLTIGFLPRFSDAGIFSTIALIICRLLQGLSFGGELPGATTIVAEFSPLKRRGYRASFVIASVSLGALSASFILFIMTRFFTENEILAWGFRIPFLIGGVLGIILFLARKNMMETPEFQSLEVQEIQHKPLKQLILHKRTSVLIGCGLTAFLAAMVVVNLYFPYFIHQYYHFQEMDIYFAITLSLIFSALIFPFMGILSDRFSKQTLLKWVTLSYASLSIPLFMILSSQSIYFLILFMIIHQLYIAIFSACYFPMLVNLFPPAIRYTGIALCYNLVYVIMSNLPSALTALLAGYQTPEVVPLVLSGLAMLSLFAVFFENQKNIKQPIFASNI